MSKPAAAGVEDSPIYFPDTQVVGVGAKIRPCRPSFDFVPSASVPNKVLDINVTKVKGWPSK